MSMKRNQCRLIVMAALIACVGQAVAADIVCPDVTKSEQSAVKDGGAAYTINADGLTWSGENYLATVGDDLSSLELKEVTFVNTKHFVYCDYVGKGDAAVRMTAKTAKNLVPVNPAVWDATKNGNDPASICTMDKGKPCAFKEGG